MPGGDTIDLTGCGSDELHRYGNTLVGKRREGAR